MIQPRHLLIAGAIRFFSRKRATSFVVVIAASTAAGLAEYPTWSQSALYASLNVLTAGCYAVVGLRLWVWDRQRWLGIGLITIGVIWSAQWVTSWNTGLFPFAGVQLNSAFYVIGGLSVFHYPAGQPVNCADKAFMASLILVIVFADAVVFTSLPQWSGFSPSVWWPHFEMNRRAASTVKAASYLAEIAIAIGVACGVRLRWKRVRGVDRVVTIPIVVGFSAVGLLSGLSQTSQLYPTTTIDDYYFWITIAVLLIPLGYLIALVVKRLEHAGVAAGFNRTLAEQPPSVELIRAGLRVVLHDPSLEVYYWSPDIEDYVDSRGRPSKPDTTNLKRFIREVKARDGSYLATITGEPSLGNHTAIVDTALNASTIALENARLQAGVLQQLEEVRNSRARIAQAAMAERQRIERDLHDGVQQRLLALVTRVGTARRTEQPDATFEWITRDLLATIEDVRSLGQGIHPAELRQFGIKPALQLVSSGLPLAIEIAGTDGRHSELVEGTAYFVACEALTNTAKHARASKACVQISQRNETLYITISDDGVGGAKMNSGRGLTGLVDRVSAVGGRLVLTSNLGKGTTLKAEIPCA